MPQTEGVRRLELSITADEFLSLSFSYHMDTLSGTNTLEERFFYIRAAARDEERSQRQDTPTGCCFSSYATCHSSICLALVLKFSPILNRVRASVA